MKAAWILIALVVAGTAYFFVFANSFEPALSELRGLEGRVGVGGTTLLPATKEKLAQYSDGLGILKKKWAASKPFSGLAEIKISLAETEKSLFFVADEFEKINRLSPNCSPQGEIEALKKKSGEIKRMIGTSLSKRNSFLANFENEAGKVSEVYEDSFRQTMDGTAKGIDRIVQILGTYCT